MKIFDCFMYYDENVVLDLRLNVLDKFVDKFIIVESTYTHSGENRKLLFDIKFPIIRQKVLEFVAISIIGYKRVLIFGCRITILNHSTYNFTL